MKKIALLGLIGAALAGCGDKDTTKQYICANGPDLIANYAEDGSVTLLLNNDRTEKLSAPDPARPFIYSNASGMRWADNGQTARLDFDRKSYLCDAISN